MTVIYNMSIDRADKPWIGDRRFTEQLTNHYGSITAVGPQDTCNESLNEPSHVPCSILVPRPGGKPPG